MGPFTDGDLKQSAPFYTKWITGVFYRDLLGRFSAGQMSEIGDVHLEVPLEMKGAPDSGFVLNIASDPVSRRVVLPVRTLRWLDEYCGLIPYLEGTKCAMRTTLPLIYDAMLVLPGRGQRPPGPFAAFKLGDWIYKDTVVKDVSNKLCNTIVVFLLSHELGHIARNHQGGLSGLRSQAQEREADDYAFDIMAQIGINPIGLVFLFSAAAMMECGQDTHPLSGTRVIAAAEQMERRPRGFVDHSEPDPERRMSRILSEAREIRGVISLIDQTERRSEILQTAQHARFDQLPDFMLHL